MEIDRFIEVIKNYSESSEHEALEIISLKETFPYSQLLRALSARMSKDHSFIDQQSELQFAAVYAADRVVLKDVMTLDRLRPYETKKTKKQRIPKKTIAEEDPVGAQADIAPTTQDFDPGSVAEEVMIDLEKLHHLRHNFEMMFPDSVVGSSATPGEKEEPPQSSKVQIKESSQAAPILPKHRKESSKTKKQRIIETAKALEASKEADLKTLGTPETKKRKGGKSEGIIEEIISTKQEIVPKTEKQKKQLEIIEQFIKTQPSISQKKDAPRQVPPGDLATIKTGEFSDKIVSETLVEILLKQGKSDKAIEVLKKLIWKYPQKKAYFAAQIEELKK